MKTALVQCPSWWTVDPPLGLAQAAGALRARGHEAAVFDLNIQLARRAGKSYANLWNWEQFHFWNDPAFVARFFRDHAGLLEEQLAALLGTGAGLIGFSIYAGSQLASLEFARRIKAADPSRRIVFGGQYFHLGSKAREILQDPAVDAVIRGAGDLSLPRLADRLQAAGELAPVPGALVKAGGEKLDGGPETELKDLDELPFADFSGFPLELYDVPERLPFQGSRGCVWKCRFCSSTNFWKGYRSLSGKRLFAELLHHKKLFPGKTHFEFYDLTANGDVRALESLCDLIIADWKTNRAEHFFGWKINAILRPEMTPGLLAKLREANCHDIIYGIESGSPRVLGLMKKPFSIATAERVLRDTKAAGIKTIGNFMFGFPGETEEDFAATLAFLRRNKDSFDRVYASATFTSLEEHSYLTEHRAESGVRVEPGREFHHLYWESQDGTNDYLVRLDRYERFRRLAAELGLDAYKGLAGNLELDRFANLAQYHRYRGDHRAAVRNLLEYLERDLYSEPMRAELRRYLGDLTLLARGLRAAARARAGGAERAFAAMRDRARSGGGGTAWGAGERTELREIEGLRDRARMMLALAEAEIASGESRREAPACAR